MADVADRNPKRFLFTQSFDLETLAAAQKQEVAPSFSETELHTAREQAYGQGFVAGKEAAVAEAAQTQNILLGNLEQLLHKVAGEVWRAHAQQSEAAAQVALAIARRIVPDTLARNGVQEMLAQINGALGEMISEPRLVLRVGDAHFDFVSEQVKALAVKLGYGGKLIILADSALGQHDCRLEWADGGMERKIDHLWSDLTRATGHAPAPSQTHSAPRGDTPAPSTILAV